MAPIVAASRREPLHAGQRVPDDPVDVEADHPPARERKEEDRDEAQHYEEHDADEHPRESGRARVSPGGPLLPSSPHVRFRVASNPTDAQGTRIDNRTG